MKIAGKHLERLRVVQPEGVDDQCLVSAEAYRTCKGRIEFTGEVLRGRVILRDLIEWAFREGFLTWQDDVFHRSDLQIIRH